jgi:hypothetical protein
MSEKGKNAKDPKEAIAEEEHAPAAVQLGREAKIGLAVILSLVIVLGIVTVWRFTRPKPEAMASPAPAEAQPAAEPKSQTAEAGADSKGGLPDVPKSASPVALTPAKAAAHAESPIGDQDLFSIPPAKSEKSELPTLTARTSKPESKLQTSNSPPPRGSFMPERAATDVASPREASGQSATAAAAPGADAASLPPPPKATGDSDDRYGLKSAPSKSPAAEVGDRYADRARSSQPEDPPQNTSRWGGDAVAVEPDPAASPAQSPNASPSSPSGSVAEAEPPRGEVAVASNNLGERYHSKSPDRSTTSGLSTTNSAAGWSVSATEKPKDRPRASSAINADKGATATTTVSTRQNLQSSRAYTVVEGDTLFNIARYELGKASRWAEIYDLNRDTLGKNIADLPPGTQLILPRDEKGDTQARQPKSGLDR